MGRLFSKPMRKAPSRYRFTADIAREAPSPAKQPSKKNEDKATMPYATIKTSDDGEHRVERSSSPECDPSRRYTAERFVNGDWVVIEFFAERAAAFTAIQRMAGEIDTYMEPRGWRLLYAGSDPDARTAAASRGGV